MKKLIIAGVFIFIIIIFVKIINDNKNTYYSQVNDFTEIYSEWIYQKSFACTSAREWLMGNKIHLKGLPALLLVDKKP